MAGSGSPEIVRYVQGGRLTDAGRAARERVRLQAVERMLARVKTLIGRLFHVSYHGGGHLAAVEAAQLVVAAARSAGD